MKALLIANPIAGKGHVWEKAQEVASKLERLGWHLGVEATQSPGDATRLAREAAASGCEVVLVCGGDGTLNEAVNGLAGSQTALGVIPVGTANTWAREIGLPAQPAAAALTLAQGEIRRVDLGLAGNRYFLLMAGVGFDAAVVAALDLRLKALLGTTAYILTGLWEGLGYEGTPVEILADGQRLHRHILWALLGNTRLYGGLVRITSKAVANDGLLDICLFEAGGLPGKASQLLEVFGQGRIRSRRVLHFRGSVLTFVSASPLPIQVDGDLVGTTPMTFRVAPMALSVLLPKELPKGLLA